jgi:hypothetical protein
MARKILVSGLALAPLAAILRWVIEAGDVVEAARQSRGPPNLYS